MKGRSAAAFAALVVAVTGVGLAGPAAGSPLAESSAVAAPEVDAAANLTVSGSLLYEFDSAGSLAPVTTGNGLVRFWLQVPGQFELVRTVDTFGPTGNWSTAGLAAGTYVLEFISFDGPTPTRHYWYDQQFFSEATKVSFVDGQSYTFTKVVLEPRTLNYSRIEGPSRFETAVEISQTIWPSTAGGGITYVYIINGLSYADALSAGPAAATRGGVVLPVLKNSIPSVVLDEIERLDPQKIIVVGSSLAISESVKNTLEAYVNHPDDVYRSWGANRYETSYALVQDAFSVSNTDTVFVSTGRNFPDALAAGPAANHLRGPVLLVDGLSSGITADQRQLLKDLGRPDIVITGSERAVSASMAASLQSTLGDGRRVTRLAGADRFDTARVINEFAFGAPETYPDYAFIANGLGYADALTGGPLASKLGAPMYLSRPECLSSAVYGDLLDLIVTEVYALGSPLALSDRVLDGDRC